MRVAITGSSGLIGSALVKELAEERHEFVRVVRSRGVVEPPDIGWNPATGAIDRHALAGVDALVHLAGEPLTGRWTDRKKEFIYDSRVPATRMLVETIAGLPEAPRVIVAASAVGFYGDRGNEELREDAAAGEGFLAELCREWETATRLAESRGIRVVNLRLGLVVTPKGGALRAMLPLFRVGLGGRLGSGKQYVSWITLDDVVRTVNWALVRDDLRGPMNTVAPHPVRNAEFTASLRRVLHRLPFFPVPAFLLRAAAGPMANAVLLPSVRAVPARLLASGFVFRYPELEDALGNLLR